MLSLLFIFQTSLALRVFAQDEKKEQARVELPTSPVGKVVGLLLKALNSEDQTAQLNFIRTNFSEQSLKETTPDAWLVFFKKLHQQSGGLDVMQVSLDSINADNVKFQVSR